MKVKQGWNDYKVHHSRGLVPRHGLSHSGTYARVHFSPVGWEGVLEKLLYHWVSDCWSAGL